MIVTGTMEETFKWRNLEWNILPEFQIPNIGRNLHGKHKIFSNNIPFGFKNKHISDNINNSNSCLHSFLQSVKKESVWWVTWLFVVTSTFVSDIIFSEIICFRLTYDVEVDQPAHLLLCADLTLVLPPVCPGHGPDTRWEVFTKKCWIFHSEQGDSKYPHLFVFLAFFEAFP